MLGFTHMPFFSPEKLRRKQERELIGLLISECERLGVELSEKLKHPITSRNTPVKNRKFPGKSRSSPGS